MPQDWDRDNFPENEEDRPQADEYPGDSYPSVESDFFQTVEIRVQDVKMLLEHVHCPQMGCNSQ